MGNGKKTKIIAYIALLAKKIINFAFLKLFPVFSPMKEQFVGADWDRLAKHTERYYVQQKL